MATGLKYYFGIDFGTTNSATVGYVVMDQKPEAVKYGDEEGRPIPSVVAIDKTTGAVFTGREAWDKKMELSESCEYISSVKTNLDSEQIKTIAGREWTAVDVASEVFKYPSMLLFDFRDKIHNIVWSHIKRGTDCADHVGVYILIVCQLVHLIMGDAGSFFQIFLFHIPINKNMPQLLITNSHFESPLWAIWCRVQ